MPARSTRCRATTYSAELSISTSVMPSADSCAIHSGVSA
jgi:hypothetical protein